MKEWMNEWMNEVLSEWMNKLMNEWLNELINYLMKNNFFNGYIHVILFKLLSAGVFKPSEKNKMVLTKQTWKSCEIKRYKMSGK